MDRHIAFDIGAAEVTRLLAQRLGAPAVLAGYSRLLIDVNRQPGDPGSIPEHSDGHQVPANMGLDEPAQVSRVRRFFDPYHQAIGERLAHLRRTGPVPVLFSVHSFTPHFAGQARPWHVGVLWNRDPRVAVPLLDCLRRNDDHKIGDNEPYSGRHIAYTINRHGAAAGLPNCAVEIRQDLIADAVGAEKWAAIVGDALAEILTLPSLHRIAHF